ncbi:alkaline phosphatase D family protein [Sphingopyxis sp. BSN-002]|uniref:alkaline phosphatase D family protein n=1 Tax=Sphingopyxis sp. BSN-002 TaxID=2911495 RepID=UPI001EDAFBF4|nr:alkaline phosphatase D family protein [Sphingopyxis sp. BSN-002]UKK85163.1 alkaline phosphatase D family protein [Sphingopyxis sp. BSN-002]
MNRRQFLASAASIGISGIWASRSAAAPSRLPWREDREAFPQGVASGDPDEHSIILWTRRPFDLGDRHELTVEVARDPDFHHVVAAARTPVLAAADWTCRAMVGGLSPATVYWYRFIDDSGAGSRIGRTITAPRASDRRSVRFAFVSCNSVNEGAQNAYRRMIWEDERAPADRKLGFVLHLGDFIYELVEYPEETPNRYSRTVYDLGHIPDGRKIGNFYVPTNLAGYRHVYRAHIDDPDIQDARAHFPFVCMGDNHEFSWQGWQSFVRFGGKVEPAQQLRVDANQAWWEYIPSRVRKASGDGLEQFAPPVVADAPIDTFDEHGFATEPNSVTAIASMTTYRALRYGRNVDLILTDLHSYKAADPTDRAEAGALDSGEYPVLPQEWLEIVDGGKDYDGGKPPATITVGDGSIPNYRRDEGAYTVLGAPQKAWLKERLTRSTATWKIWGLTNGPLDMRTDPQNLPEGVVKGKWPGKDYGVFPGVDFSGAFAERAEIYDLVRDRKISGFVTVSGDRHSFWAGYAAPKLPPAGFDPVGLSFITGSVSAPGLGEAAEFFQESAQRPLYVRKVEGAAPEHTINLTVKRGVRAALEYAASGDIAKARALTNPDVAPHLEFVDMAGHGYSVVTAGPDAIETEFVCIVRPIARATTPDGGPLRYRVSHRADMWRPGARPRMEQRILEGDARLSV